MDPLPPPAAAGARRVLLVDDEPVIRRALHRFFQRQGWQVDEADDGAGALALLLAAGAAPYDVILSDLRMPGMSGEEFYDAVAAARPAQAARVVVTTGDSFTPEATRFLARTGCEVLNKPFELAELRAIVERVAGPGGP
jgi:two-component system NtrC family sensor kinase